MEFLRLETVPTLSPVAEEPDEEEPQEATRSSFVVVRRSNQAPAAAAPPVVAAPAVAGRAVAIATGGSDDDEAVEEEEEEADDDFDEHDDHEPSVTIVKSKPAAAPAVDRALPDRGALSAQRSPSPSSSPVLVPQRHNEAVTRSKRAVDEVVEPARGSPVIAHRASDAVDSVNSQELDPEDVTFDDEADTDAQLIQEYHQPDVVSLPVTEADAASDEDVPEEDENWTESSASTRDHRRHQSSRHHAQPSDRGRRHGSRSRSHSRSRSRHRRDDDRHHNRGSSRSRSRHREHHRSTSRGRHDSRGRSRSPSRSHHRDNSAERRHHRSSAHARDRDSRHRRHSHSSSRHRSRSRSRVSSPEAAPTSKSGRHRSQSRSRSPAPVSTGTSPFTVDGTSPAVPLAATAAQDTARVVVLDVGEPEAVSIASISAVQASVMASASSNSQIVSVSASHRAQSNMLELTIAHPSSVNVAADVQLLPTAAPLPPVAPLAIVPPPMLTHAVPDRFLGAFPVATTLASPVRTASQALPPRRSAPSSPTAAGARGQDTQLTAFRIPSQTVQSLAFQQLESPSRRAAKGTNTLSNPTSDADAGSSDTDLNSDDETTQLRRAQHQSTAIVTARQYHSVEPAAREGARRVSQDRSRSHSRVFVKAGPRHRSVSPLLMFLRDNGLEYDSEGEDSAEFYAVPSVCASLDFLSLHIMRVCDKKGC